MADEEQRIAKEQDVLKTDLNVRQAQLQREQEELVTKERELAGQGKLNRDDQKKVHEDRKRLETAPRYQRRSGGASRTCSSKRMRDEESKLASQRKKIEDRKKELEKEEREASKGLQVPPYWKNKTRIHFVTTKFVRNNLQKFMVESSCCPATKQTRVLSVERVENESLWQMYQFRRDILKKSCATQRIRALSTATNWQPDIPSKAEMSTNINEFYLFHGTSSKNAHFISEHGFDERVTDLNGL